MSDNVAYLELHGISMDDLEAEDGRGIDEPDAAVGVANDVHRIINQSKLDIEVGGVAPVRNPEQSALDILTSQNKNHVIQQEAIIEAIEAAKDGLEQEELLGECPYNARRLYDELQERDILAHIVRGACEKPDEPQPNGLAAAEDAGLVHWWVEAKVDGTWMTIDLATEDTRRLGETICQPTRPEPYLPFVIDPTDSKSFDER